jgi:hypothetical protein
MKISDEWLDKPYLDAADETHFRDGFITGRTEEYLRSDGYSVFNAGLLGEAMGEMDGNKIAALLKSGDHKGLFDFFSGECRAYVKKSASKRAEMDYDEEFPAGCDSRRQMRFG